MPKPKPKEFRMRMSPDLRAILDDVRGKKSLNGQINEWLWSKALPDDAERLTDALRPLLATLSEADREKFVFHATTAVETLAKANAGKRRK